MKLTLSFAIILMMALAVSAQEFEKRPWMPLESRVGLALGIGSITYLDQNTSPLIYHSKPKNLRLFYNLESKHFLLAVNIDVKAGGNGPKRHPNRTMYFQEEYMSGETQHKKFPAGGSMLAGRISLGAFYKISSTQESTFKVAVGGSISNELFYPQGWTSGGLFNALSISPEAWTQHRINEHHSFTASIRIPLMTHLTRLPYDNTVSKPDKNMAGGFFSNGEWVGPKKFHAPAMSIGYNYQLNQRWGTGLNYEFGWYNIPEPQRMRATTQSLLANFYHQF